MPSAHLLRLQIEAVLSERIPSALTPAPGVIRPAAPTGIVALDERLGGGLPLGSISELAGPECSGRTSLALSFVAGMTQAGRVCAWVDVSDMLHPESAAAIGVDLARLLWVRCGPKPQQRSLPGFAVPARPEKPAPGIENPRTAETAVSCAPRCAEPQPRVRHESREARPYRIDVQPPPARAVWPAKPWPRLDQALRATDLLLQAGGFSAVVLDMGSIAPEDALRVPLATWFRYRAAAQRTQASLVLLTQQACTKSSAGVVLYCVPGQVHGDPMVFAGAEYRVEIARERFAKVAEFARKPPQRESGAGPEKNGVRWQSRTSWEGQR